MTALFSPPLWLRSPHLQTLIATSAWRRFRIAGSNAALESASSTVTINCRDGARLVACVTDADDNTPLVIIIHGWLGGADSSYVMAMAGALHSQGFRIARLNLRDHGGSESLNEDVFHSARIGEVIDACAWLQQHCGGAGTALMGYSLGGNFALRVAAADMVNLRGCLAICPVMDPKASTYQIDRGWFVYRTYFVRRWRDSLLAKQRAFPTTYDFEPALRCRTIASLTDYFVERHTRFRDSDEYFSHYTLSAERLSSIRTPTRIVTAADDPMIPVAPFHELGGNDAIRVIVTRHGGHCAYLRNLHCDSFIDEIAADFLAGDDVALRPAATASRLLP